MNSMEGLLYGLELGLQPATLLAAFIGAFLGMVVGVLPGLGPVAGAALILPVTFAYEPAIGLIMIAGIYLGSQFGGSISSILLNIPGDASSVVATFDGHKMMKQGRGGAAIIVMCLGSFIAGLLGVGILLWMAPVVTSVASSFGAAEFFALTAGGLLALARVSGGRGKSSLGASLLPMAIGLLLSTVGSEPIQSYPRFTFGNLDMSLGLSLATVAVGLYGISEVVNMIQDRTDLAKTGSIKVRDLIPTKNDLKRSITPWLRGTAVGYGFGLLPVPSATFATFGSYKVESIFSKNRRKLGTGAVEGIAGPEAANSSASIASLVPVLMLGLPFSATLALMISAMVVQGIQPGPLLIEQRPDVFWTVIASVLIANVMLLFINIPMVGLWVRVLRVPRYVLAPAITLLAVVGAYSINSNMIDIWIVIAVGMLGYYMKKAALSLASLLVGVVLGPLIERYFVQGMLIGGGDPLYFVSSPLALSIWFVVALLVLVPMVNSLVRRFRSRPMDHAGGTMVPDEASETKMEHQGRWHSDG